MDPPAQFIHVANTCVGGRENAVWLSRMPNGNDIILRGETPERNEKAISVTVADPPMLAGNVLAETLKGNGIQVSGSVLRDRTIRETLGDKPTTQSTRSVVLAIHETPLQTVIARANKDSMNLYAEALCKRIGFAATGQPGSWENGPANVGKFLRSVGVMDDQFDLDDGCGLSKKNHISADAMTRVLMYEFFGPKRDAYLKSLAIAGVDGTLDDRFKGSDLRGRVFAKSGFVAGVSCLSGYLKARDGRWFAFSILMNGIPDGSNSSIKPLQERIVKAIER
jgi:D-alanyl-D-alanine carboxypeptidase/D-alanyl-D-alanine-endopeptidase (penicillin-binding protein 4)